MKTAARFLLVMALATAGTWIIGWWAVPVVALASGFVGTRGAIAAAGCAAAWLGLLLSDLFAGSFGRLGDQLGGIMGLPLPALIAVTLLFPALLGWSAASLGDATRTLVATSRRPS